MAMTNSTTKSTFLNDPIGEAILDFAKNGEAEDIIVESDICENDTIPVTYLFRNFEEMPSLEQEALKRCSGKILDIGCGGGAHLKWLQAKEFDCTGIDVSRGCIDYLNEQGISAIQKDFRNLKEEKYDTLLLMMNGIGIAGDLNGLIPTLACLKQLLAPNGKILLDSTDIQYLYTDDEGGVWTDMNSEYYGNFMFRMSYKDHTSDWFKWLYVDFENLSKAADAVNLDCQLILEEDDQYLAELRIK